MGGSKRRRGRGTKRKVWDGWADLLTIYILVY
jgi:hypothetical protein